MARFIVDANVAGDESAGSFPTWFFKDLRNNSNYSLVTGGSKYSAELSKNTKLMFLIQTFERAGKVKSLSRDIVDKKCAEIKSEILRACGSCPSECDDPHLFALAIIGDCSNLISHDKRIAKCRRKVRGKIGHDKFPALRVINCETVYCVGKKKGIH